METIVNAIENEEGVFNRDVMALFAPVYAIVAEGRPALAEELAAATGRSTEEIIALIKPLQVTSICPATGQPVAVQVEPDRIAPPTRPPR